MFRSCCESLRRGDRRAVNRTEKSRRRNSPKVARRDHRREARTPWLRSKTAIPCHRTWTNELKVDFRRTSTSARSMENGIPWYVRGDPENPWPSRLLSKVPRREPGRAHRGPSAGELSHDAAYRKYQFREGCLHGPCSGAAFWGPRLARLSCLEEGVDGAERSASWSLVRINWALSLAKRAGPIVEGEAPARAPLSPVGAAWVPSAVSGTARVRANPVVSTRESASYWPSSSSGASSNLRVGGSSPSRRATALFSASASRMLRAVGGWRRRGEGRGAQGSERPPPVPPPADLRLYQAHAEAS